jgi:hypothetical protein
MRSGRGCRGADSCDRERHQRQACAAPASLQARGDRAQRSVAAIGEDMLPDAHDWIGLLISLQVGRLRCTFRQCAACWEAVGIYGQATVTGEVVMEGGLRSWRKAATCACRLPAETAARRPPGRPLRILPRRPVQPGRISAGHGPTNRGRVRNEVTPEGVWKHPLLADDNIKQELSETRSRQKAYGNHHRAGYEPCAGEVRNEVTPEGVWKRQDRAFRFRRRPPSVRNEVTPEGVWKQCGQHDADQSDWSETRSRQKAYGCRSNFGHDVVPAIAPNKGREKSVHQLPASGPLVRRPLRPAPIPSAPPGPAASSQLAVPPSTDRRPPTARPPTAGMHAAGRRPRQGDGQGQHRAGPAPRQGLRAPARRRSPRPASQCRSPGHPVLLDPAQAVAPGQPAVRAGKPASGPGRVPRLNSREHVTLPCELRTSMWSTPPRCGCSPT